MRNKQLIVSVSALFGVACAASCTAIVSGELDDKPSNQPSAIPLTDAAQADAGTDTAVEEDALTTDALTTDAGADSSQQPPDAAMDAAVDVDGDAELDSSAEASLEAGSDGSSDATADQDSVDAQQDAPDEGPCEACSADQCCNNACVDLNTDENHCGSCGNRCSTGRACEAGQCQRGWSAVTSTNELSARVQACGAAQGPRAFIWGGRAVSDNTVLGDGALYNPTNDKWTAVSVPAAPTARAMATCVGTAQGVLVWGGVDANNQLLSDGAFYRPSTHSWTAVNSVKNPAGRLRPLVVASHDRTKVFLIGGENANGTPQNQAALLHTDTGQWELLTEPHNRGRGIAGVWTGETVLVFGGRDGGNGALNKAYVLRTTDNRWNEVTIAGDKPAKRSHSFAAWVTDKMIVCGGISEADTPLSDCWALTLTSEASGTWQQLPTNGLVGRAAVPFTAGWAFAEGATFHMLGGIVGGTSGDVVARDGASYSAGAWTPIEPWPQWDHKQGVGVWTGTEFVVWGGTNGSGQAVGGSRWMP